MKDLTTGSIPKHIVQLAAPMAAGMIFQTMYILIDLFFVAQLGDASIAGVGAAANAQFIIMALTQVLGVGTMALIAQSIGRKDVADARLVFNQSTSLALLCGCFTLAAGYALAPVFLGTVGADEATRVAGVQYLYAYLPGLALQFALVSTGSALRGAGVVTPGMVVQIITVVLNALLAPVLIAGWGTGRALGTAGAGLASSISIAVGVVLMLWYFNKLEQRLSFDWALARVRMDVWKRILRIGLPSGGEFAIMFLFTAIIYWLIRDFGAAAQAGYGVGFRVMQAVFLPAMAVAFATAPLAGQNVGAGHYPRVRETFHSAVLLGSVLMVCITLFCQWKPDLLVRLFTKEEAVVAVGAGYLRVVSWNFVASGILFTISGMFQALGNTVPSLISSASRLLTFALPAVWLSTRPGFTLRQIWLLAVATTLVQLVLSYLLLRRELHKRLSLPQRPPSAIAVAAALALMVGSALVSSPRRAHAQVPSLHGTLVVTNKTPSTATIIDIATGRALATLPTGKGPHEIALAGDGRVAVVTDYGLPPRNTLTVLDVPGKRVIRTIDLGTYRAPHGIVFLPGDSLVAVTSEATGNVLIVHVGEGAIRRVVPTRAEGSHMVGVARDGVTAWTGNMRTNSVSQLDLAAGTFIRTIPVPNTPEAINVTADGREVWVGSNATGRVSVVDAATGSVTTAAEGVKWPYRVLFTPDHATVVIPDMTLDEVRFLDRASRRELGRLSFPVGGPQGVTLTPDGRHLFLSLSKQARVAVIDIGRRAVIGYVPAGETPDGVVFTPSVLR